MTTSFLSASHLSKSATNTASRLVPSNSLYGVLQTTDTIFKLESTNDFPLIQISAKATKAMNILVQQSYDNVVEPGGGVPSLISTQVFSVVAENPLNGLTVAQTFYAQITYPFFRLALINTAGVAGDVYLTTKLVATTLSAGGGIATLNPTDDGVSIFGSADGITPILVRTDALGQLIMNDVSPIPGGGTITIKGNNDYIVPQTTPDGIMEVLSVDGDLALGATLVEVSATTTANTTNTTPVINKLLDINDILPRFVFYVRGEVIFGSSISVGYNTTISVLANVNDFFVLLSNFINGFAFQYSNDGANWFFGPSFPTKLLYNNTIAPMPPFVPYPVNYYTFSVDIIAPAPFLRVIALSNLNLGVNEFKINGIRNGFR